MAFKIEPIHAGKDHGIFKVDRPGLITFIGHHLSTTVPFHCTIRSISVSDAVIEVDSRLEIPQNFFLEIVGIRDEIGCTVSKRENSLITAAFNMNIDAEFLHHVQRLNFELDG